MTSPAHTSDGRVSLIAVLPIKIRSSALSQLHDEGTNSKRCRMTSFHAPVAAIGLVALFSRSNISEARNFNIFFMLAVSFLATAIGIISLKYIVQLEATYCITKGLNSQRFLAVLRYLLFGYGTNIINVTVSLSTGFYLLARVTTGQCIDSNDIWKSQSCNPVASARSIPHDQVMICYLLPIIMQLTVKGASFQVAVSQWLTTSIFVFTSLVLVEGWLQIWTLLYSVFFLYISFEIEQSLVKNRNSEKRFPESCVPVSETAHPNHL